MLKIRNEKMRKNAFLWVENVLKEICKKNRMRENEDMPLKLK